MSHIWLKHEHSAGSTLVGDPKPGPLGAPVNAALPEAVQSIKHTSCFAAEFFHPPQHCPNCRAQSSSKTKLTTAKRLLESCQSFYFPFPGTRHQLHTLFHESDFWFNGRNRFRLHQYLSSILPGESVFFYIQRLKSWAPWHAQMCGRYYSKAALLNQWAAKLSISGPYTFCYSNFGIVQIGIIFSQGVMDYKSQTCSLFETQ